MLTSVENKLNIDNFMPTFLTFKTFLKNLVPPFPIFFGLCEGGLGVVGFKSNETKILKYENLVKKFTVCHLKVSPGKLISTFFDKNFHRLDRIDITF